MSLDQDPFAGLKADLVAITDADVELGRPANRALIAGRLDLIWQACLPHITGDEIVPDYRYADLGMRVLDRLAKLARVHDKPLPAVEEAEPDPVADRAQILARIANQLERGEA